MDIISSTNTATEQATLPCEPARRNEAPDTSVATAIANSPPPPAAAPDKPPNMSAGCVKLRTWLNKSFRVEMVDGRVLIGVFLCTDRDANVILGSCTEYLPPDETPSGGGAIEEEPRMLGLVMIPGKHIVSVSLDQSGTTTTIDYQQHQLPHQLDDEGVEERSRSGAAEAMVS